MSKVLEARKMSA